MTPRIGSLFSGYGGLDLAVEEVLGGETVWHCEVEPAPSKILAARWPGVPNLCDVTAVDWAAVEPVDVICGGSPCQDVSAAGKRAGMRAGTRSGLWASMCDAIDIIRPALVVWETEMTGLFCEHSDVYSATWPTSGTTQAGTAYEQPMSVPLTDGSVYSLLPTPDVPTGGEKLPADAVRVGSTVLRADGTKVQVHLSAAVELLPTPVADHSRGLPQPGTAYASLPNVVIGLLPTPAWGDHRAGPTYAGGNPTLPGAVQLLPTPRVGADRTSRSAATRSDSRSGPSLGQAVEIARGELPREFNTWEELPQSWHGDSTRPPSADGNKPSDDPHQPPPTSHPKAVSDSRPDSSNG